MPRSDASRDRAAPSRRSGRPPAVDVVTRTSRLGDNAFHRGKICRPNARFRACALARGSNAARNTRITRERLMPAMQSHRNRHRPLPPSLRCRRGRRGFRRHVHAAPAARARASTRRSSSRAAMSAAPGTGTAIPARAATSRACNIPIRSPTNCSRNGTGPSATRRSPKSCDMPATSPTASICAATSSSTPAWRRAVFDEAHNRWTVTTSDGSDA